MCFAKNEAVTTEIGDVLAAIQHQIEARDQAKEALDGNLAEQEERRDHIRKMDGLIGSIEKEGKAGLAGARAVQDALREIEAAQKATATLHASEVDLRSSLARTQYELDCAVRKALQPIRQAQQGRVHQLVSQAYQVADDWSDALRSFGTSIGIELGRSLRLSPTAHSRVSETLYGAPPLEQIVSSDRTI